MHLNKVFWKAVSQTVVVFVNFCRCVTNHVNFRVHERGKWGYDRSMGNMFSSRYLGTHSRWPSSCTVEAPTLPILSKQKAGASQVEVMEARW